MWKWQEAVPLLLLLLVLVPIWTAAKKAMQRQLRQIGPINSCNTVLGGPRGSDPEMHVKCRFHGRVLDKSDKTVCVWLMLSIFTYTKLWKFLSCTYWSVYICVNPGSGRVKPGGRASRNSLPINWQSSVYHVWREFYAASRRWFALQNTVEAEKQHLSQAFGEIRSSIPRSHCMALTNIRPGQW